MKLFSHISLAVAVSAVFLLSACKLEAPAIFITVAVTGEPTGITEEEAVLHGSARLPEKTPDDLQLGFLISIDKNVIKSGSQEIIVFPEQKKEEGKGEQTKADGGEGSVPETEVDGHEIPAGQEFAVKVVGFEHGTTYYYRSFALCNGFYSYGAVVSFTTLGTPPQGDTPDDNQDTAPEEDEEVGD